MLINKLSILAGVRALVTVTVTKKQTNEIPKTNQKCVIICVSSRAREREMQHSLQSKSHNGFLFTTPKHKTNMISLTCNH